MQYVLSVLTACCKYNVAHLVYTSTYNVVFGGQVIRNGDESLPYLPLEKVRHNDSPFTWFLRELRFNTLPAHHQWLFLIGNEIILFNNVHLGPRFHSDGPNLFRQGHPSSKNRKKAYNAIFCFLISFYGL